ncbi:YeeE/YedE family protein [Massilia sp. H6]|uniref:YeeE/YedE family protein n=1 Tax=Massilia sp. H6 TaxID=2970464 RepID=UPI00216A9B0C|nr:YeeE/YedE family protein [Massilia sp. H6]UVW30071.1 YeeE/YedE family protein [Massilia sp. H6]
MNLSSGAWDPYLVGALIGVLSMATFYFSNKPLGVSTAYARVAGLLGYMVSKPHTDALKFYQDKSPKVEWEVMLLLGTVLGGFIAAFSGGEFNASFIPPMWAAQFGNDFSLRLIVAFVGGIVMAFGARLAGGCTSGHGISGTLQLSVGSWIALAAFFAGGAITARVMYG